MSNNLMNVNRRSFMRGATLLGATALSSGLMGIPFAHADDFKPTSGEKLYFRGW